MKKSERLNQELIFLSGKGAFQLSDLMAEFGISKRTALRDVAELESLGLPLYAESGRYGGYRLISQKPFVPVYFTIEEVEAIFFAMKALKLLSSTPFSHSFEATSPEAFGDVASNSANYDFQAVVRNRLPQCATGKSRGPFGFDCSSNFGPTSACRAQFAKRRSACGAANRGAFLPQWRLVL